jgi:hypothetical protein
MIRETIVALAVLVLVVTIPGLSSGTPAPQWSYQVTNPDVPQGSDMLVEVQGPPNGTFSMTISPVPFNTSQPVFTQTYELPLAASLPNGTAMAEVRLNTSLFAIAGYQVALKDSAGSAVGTPSVVQVTVPVDPAIMNAISQLEFNLGVNASRVNSLLYLKSQVLEWTEFAVGWSIAWTVVLMYLIFATRTAARERKWVAKSLDLGHSLVWTPRGQTFSDGWEPEKRTTKPDYRAIYVVKPPECEVCEMPGRWESKEDHVRKTHPSVPFTPEMIVPEPRAEELARQTMRAERDSLRPSATGTKSAERAKPAGVVLDFADGWGKDEPGGTT